MAHGDAYGTGALERLSIMVIIEKPCVCKAFCV